MSIIKFRRALIEDPQTAKFQQNVEQVFQDIGSRTFIKGQVFTVDRTGLGTGSFEIQTGFTRPVEGFVVVDTLVSSTFYRIVTTRDQTIITIKPSAAGKYSFWVF